MQQALSPQSGSGVWEPRARNATLRATAFDRRNGRASGKETGSPSFRSRLLAELVHGPALFLLSVRAWLRQYTVRVGRARRRRRRRGFCCSAHRAQRRRDDRSSSPPRIEEEQAEAPVVVAAAARAGAP